MSMLVVPTSDPSIRVVWRRRIAWTLIALLAPAIAMTLYWNFAMRPAVSTGATTGDNAFYTVHPIDMNVTIAKDGELAAVNNIEIICRVEGGSTVQTLIKEGEYVKKGDVLITLDSSAIKQRIEDTTLDLQKAEADLTTSKEMREIQISQNNANLEEAQVALTLAKLNLQGYIEGTYPQLVTKAKSDLELAKLALKNKQENLAQTRNLFSKGFVTATDIKTAEQDIVRATADVSAAENALAVLTKYTHESDLASKQNALSQAEQKHVRVQRENAANLTQKTADVRAKESALETLKRRMERFEEQLAACTITAPADGLVVYATSGDRNAQNSLTEGAQVRERQVMLRLPDTSTMKAVVRVGEAQVWRLTEGQRARVTLNNGPSIEATLSGISVLADNSQRWMNPDIKEYPVDLTLDTTPTGLKPGMSVRSEILIDRVESVLAVPLPAVFVADQKHFVFASDGSSDVRPIEIKLGQINDRFAEVKSGIASGQRVKYLEIGEGQDLLARAGIKVNTDVAGADNGFRAKGKRGGKGSPRGGGNGPPETAKAPRDPAATPTSEPPPTVSADKSPELPEPARRTAPTHP